MAYIIGIASSASWSIGKSVLKKIKNKNDVHFTKAQIGTIDVNTLKEHVSKYTGINEHDLNLISFEEIERGKGKYKVWLRNQYKIISVISNRQGSISNFKVYEKSQTHI